MAVQILKAKEVKLERQREALEGEALNSMRKIVLAWEDLQQGPGVRRHKAARKFPLVMRKARRLVAALEGTSA